MSGHKLSTKSSTSRLSNQGAPGPVAQWGHGLNSRSTIPNLPGSKRRKTNCRGEVRDMESLGLDNYLKSFNHQLMIVHSLLDWWKERRTEFPTAGHATCIGGCSGSTSSRNTCHHLFSIPAMSSEVERVFSWPCLYRWMPWTV
jgi:hypothetical protein